MSRPLRRSRCGPLLALAALVLLTWAGVRSTVMQAAMAAPAPASACAEMGGMGAMAAPARPGAPFKSTPSKPAACPWCDAAAHAPLDVVVARPAPPAHAVSFAAYAAPRSSGPRGPPARRPSARDPPRLSA